MCTLKNDIFTPLKKGSKRVPQQKSGREYTEQGRLRSEIISQPLQKTKNIKSTFTGVFNFYRATKTMLL